MTKRYTKLAYIIRSLILESKWEQCEPVLDSQYNKAYGFDKNSVLLHVSINKSVEVIMHMTYNYQIGAKMDVNGVVINKDTDQPSVADHMPAYIACGTLLQLFKDKCQSVYDPGSSISIWELAKTLNLANNSSSHIASMFNKWSKNADIGDFFSKDGVYTPMYLAHKTIVNNEYYFAMGYFKDIPGNEVALYNSKGKRIFKYDDNYNSAMLGYKQRMSMF